MYPARNRLQWNRKKDEKRMKIVHEECFFARESDVMPSMIYSKVSG